MYEGEEEGKSMNIKASVIKWCMKKSKKWEYINKWNAMNEVCKYIWGVWM